MSECRFAKKPEYSYEGNCSPAVAAILVAGHRATRSFRCPPLLMFDRITSIG